MLPVTTPEPFSGTLIPSLLSRVLIESMRIEISMFSSVQSEYGCGRRCTSCEIKPTVTEWPGGMSKPWNREQNRVAMMNVIMLQQRTIELVEGKSNQHEREQLKP